MQQQRTDQQLSRRLARHVLRTGGGNDAELPAWIRLLLLDYYTVAAGGADLGSTLAARGAIHVSAGRAPEAPATLIGGGFARADEAALANGVAAHGLDLDDTYEPASLHPGTVVFPAAIAVAEAEARSTMDLLHAVAAGYDVTCALGLLLGARESYGRGFHPTGVVGAVGAAAAAGSLLGLEEDRLRHALALAASVAAGSLEFLGDGSWTKRLNAGQAAANGVRAAHLARAGFTAPATAFEGRDGFLRLYGEGLIEGRDLELPDRFGAGAIATSVKFYPCCRYMHGNIDLLRQVHDEHPGLRPEDVDRIEVAVIRAGAALVANPPERKLVIESTVDAQFSMPFAAAVALVTGTATVPQFAAAPTVARELAAWLPKVRCVTSKSLEAAFPRNWQAELKVFLADGRVIEKSETAFRGAPGDPATLEMVRDKAAGLIGAELTDRLSSHVLTADLGAAVRGWQLS